MLRVAWDVWLTKFPDLFLPIFTFFMGECSIGLTRHTTKFLFYLTGTFRYKRMLKVNNLFHYGTTLCSMHSKCLKPWVLFLTITQNYIIRKCIDTWYLGDIYYLFILVKLKATSCFLTLIWCPFCNIRECIIPEFFWRSSSITRQL